MARATKLENRVRKAIETQDPDRLRDLLRARAEIKEIKKRLGPQTKDELWEFFKEKYKIELVRVAVCPGHVSQLDFVWWVYNFGSCLAVFSRGYGKCVAAGTMIYDAESGRSVPVEDVCDGRILRLASMTEDGKIMASHGFGEPQGRKRCLRVELRSGRSIVLSHDHPLLTSSGWTCVEALVAGGHIALPRELPEPDWVVPFGDGELDMLAVLLSEGCYTGKSVGFSTGDPKILELMRRAVEPYGCRVVHSTRYDYRIAYSKGASNPVREMLDALGISHELAKHKRIPDILWSASNDQIARFLSIFWMCDGYVQQGPRVALASEHLVRDISRLLMRLGIQSGIRQKNATYDGKSFQAWTLSVRSSCFRRFYEQIHLWGDKHDRMTDVVSRKNNNNNLGRPVVSKDLLDAVGDAIRRLSRDNRRKRGLEISRRLGLKNHGSHATTHFLAQKGSSKTFSTQRFRAAIDTLPYQDWSKYEFLGSDDLWWDEIESIEDVGERETYDICVPWFGNFVADDILVHNTSLMALVGDAKATFYPGFTSFAIGPGRDQGERKYNHLLPFVVENGVIGGKEMSHVSRSIMTKTEYVNMSSIEIALGGGVENAAGPRACELHRDEIELMQTATRNKAANIPAGKKTRDGRYVPAHVVDTSTMEIAGGYVDQEMIAYLKVLEEAGVDPTTMDPIEAYHLSVERGHRPRKLMLVSCIFEISEENPTCRCMPEDQRRARLIELEMDPDVVCDCNTYQSDIWQSDDPDQPSRTRTLEDVCQGRFFRSRGYQRFDDIQTFFMDNPRDTWESAKECSQPSREGTFLRSYSQDRHGIRGYEPDPENGPIFRSTDWGSTDEHWSGWFQELIREVTVSSYKGEKIRTLPIGSKVLFAEHSKALLGNVENGRRVLAKEREWVLRWPGWRVDEGYHDNAGADAKKDWEEELGIPLVSRIRKDFKEEVKLVRTVVSGWAFYVDIVACPVADESFRGWKQVNGREVHDKHTHAMAGVRYYLHNRRVVERVLAAAGGRPQSRPVAGEDHDARAAERVQRELGGPRVEREDPNYRPGRELVGVVGAEDSPLRSKSGSIERPLHRADRPR